MGYALDANVGRLLEIRAFGSLGLDDIASFKRRLVSALPGGRVVACADFRQLEVLSAEVSNAFLGTMKLDSPLVERTAFLLDARQTLFRTQLDRILHETTNPRRRTFASAQDVESWLSEVLTAPERIRLAAFLAM
jgi:hypothetical protein